MRLIKNNTMVIMLFISSTMVMGQPTWTVNPGSYQYSMTLVTFLNVNGKTLEGAQDKVAAFVNGEVRGVASPIFVATADRHLAYLTVFANQENEDVEFKIFDSASGNVINVEKTITFRIDAQYGNAFQAFSIAMPALNSEAIIKNFGFLEIDSISTTISEDEVTIIVEFDQDLRELYPEFELSNGATLYLDRTSVLTGETSNDFSQPVVYSVLSEDESQLNHYTIKASNRQTTDTGFTSTNVITANNDGANDFWIVTDTFKYKHAEFKIMDANGRVLYESIGYNNDWNGHYKGSKLARGKYYYVVKDPATNKIIRGDILVLY